MLDNYEKQICLKYAHLVLKKKLVKSEYIEELADFLEENYTDIHEFKKRKTEIKIDFLQKYVETVMKKMIKKSQSHIKKKLELISELFELTPREMEIFQIYLFYMINDEIRELFNVFSGGRFNNFDRVGGGLIPKLLNLRTEELTMANVCLRDKGLKKAGSADIHRNIKEMFADSNVRTKRQVLECILGENLMPSLKLSEFEHIKNEVCDVKNILQNAVKEKCKGVNILFWGEVGTGKTELAKTVAKTAGLKMYTINHKNADPDHCEITRGGRLSDLKQKQQILKNNINSCILFDEAEDVMNRGFRTGEHASKAYLNRILEENIVPVIWTTNDIYSVDKAFLRRMTYAIEFKELSDDIRLKMWRRETAKQGLEVDEDKLIQLNNSYNIAPSIIANAVKTTKLTNGTQDDFEKHVACVSKLVNRGRDIKKSKQEADYIYNPALVNCDLEIENLTERIVDIGKLNFSLCLYGQSGTGKSAYARYLAEQLGVKVIIKRASDLISKYVGETEQNIANAFKEAKQEKVMLILDEADSFLQSRQNAQHSWEISQVNEMLTCMESHDYPFVCTTNLVDILDEASLRRFTFKIKFNFLNKNQIELAFNHFFDTKAPPEILSCYGLTSGDFAVVNKKAKYLGVENNSGELAVLLKDEVKMKSKDIVGTSFGFK